MTLEYQIDGPENDGLTKPSPGGPLGADMERRDGRDKVTGAARYAAEHVPAGLLHGVLKGAPGLGAVRLSNAEEVGAIPGVRLVLQDERMIRNAAQGTAGEAPVQGVSKAEYVGQPVVLVVAESFETAWHAANRLQISCEGASLPVLPENGEVDDDMQEEAITGEPGTAFSDAEVLVDETYTTPALTSAPMEPHAAVAEWHGDRLTLHGSLQMLRYNRAELADSLGIEPEKVRLRAPFVGGGFGSKLGISADCVAAALAARELGQPVRVVQHRRQVFEINTRRSETRQRIRLAAGHDGRLTGLGHEARVSNLPGEEFSEPVLQGSYFAYAAPNRLLRNDLVRLNRPAAGSVRAPGEAVGVTVFEVAMDELAGKCGIDPVELRLRNLPETEPDSDRPFSSHRLADCLTKGRDSFGWDDRPAEPRQRREGEWWIGTGMAAAVRVNMVMPAEARVRLTPDGRAVVETDMTDIGTGTYSILGQIAAEGLGLAVDDVDVCLGDTDLPAGSGSGGSFGAASTGTAVWLACEEIRREIAGRMGCDAQELTLSDRHAACGNDRRSLPEVLAGEPLSGRGKLEPGEALEKVRQATWGAVFSEVAVNDVTGEVRVRRLQGTFAVGRVLNQRTARSQAQGGMTWGLGLALTEGMVHDRRDGHIVNRDLAEYHVPVNADVPHLDVHLLEDLDPWAGPLAAKGIGELGICGSGSAILNAIHHACGVRIRDLPATPDRILSGLT
ncbi:xanthine dehydrogenase family protein molybdopterin-binding subunit [Salipiger sp. PrR003]|uniref:xanthine dehydrogenase family protein molybdopterin-binding subunit n=1 Tax=Salipiger sp. PrR003 TaxID=2706776 RepID=UPI0013DCC7DD|nr:xanthine dehydrogenase family protein molybdopterin-binding subunit [Salipiger sp. PrR003]NDV50082.1 xanthine dehydrogenase family protein molybdopterin-binding subunit [Salipiger sp. PrR003]